MKTLRKHRIYVELFILISGLIALLFNIRLLTGVLIYMGLSSLIVDLITRLVTNKKDLRLLGITVGIFALINILRHFYFYIYIISVLFENLKIDVEDYFFFIRELIWIIPSVFFIFCAIKLIRNKRNINYKEYIGTLEFKIIIGLIILSIILDIPLFYFHGDFFGYPHGHGFWDISSHIH
jgi:hypothetical protein